MVWRVQPSCFTPKPKKLKPVTCQTSVPRSVHTIRREFREVSLSVRRAFRGMSILSDERPAKCPYYQTRVSRSVHTIRRAFREVSVLSDERPAECPYYQTSVPRSVRTIRRASREVSVLSDERPAKCPYYQTSVPRSVQPRMSSIFTCT